MKILNRTQIVLLSLLVISLAINLALQPDRSSRGYQFLPEMTDSPAFESFSSNPFLPHGQTQQTPPPGTIARGRIPLPPPSPGDERPGSHLGSLLDDEEEDLLPAGRRIFTDFCTPCHGPGGEGNGPVVQRGFPAPPSLLADPARHLTDGEILYLITFGRNNMPAYGKMIQRDQRLHAIRYVRHLQRSDTGRGESPE